tara:strand:- start:4745 stop:5749 length:1005 start_codon:yes stop_codon:yes gene_type:complete
MVDHESTAILKICEDNLNASVSECILDYYSNRYELYLNEAKQADEGRKYRQARKAMRAFQIHLRSIKNEKDVRESECAQFEEALRSKCSYIGELLEQITKLKITLLSRIRKGDDYTLEIDYPSVREFCDSVFLSSTYSIFHNIEDFHQCFARKNHGLFNDHIIQNIQTTLNSFLRDAYSSFFRTPSKRDPIDDAIYKASLDGVESEDRVIPPIELRTGDNEFKDETRDIIVESDYESKEERNERKDDEERGRDERDEDDDRHEEQKESKKEEERENKKDRHEDSKKDRREEEEEYEREKERERKEPERREPSKNPTPKYMAWDEDSGDELLSVF